MIFAHTFQAVLDGRKNQTRRLVKPGDASYDDGFGYIVSVYRNERCVYDVGKTYAVQPGRGRKAVARIRITDIRREDVREISVEDVIAEGVERRSEFLETWTQMHDKPAKSYLDCDLRGTAYRQTSNDIPLYVYSEWDNYLVRRPAERYAAWVIEFELVNGSAP